MSPKDGKILLTMAEAWDGRADQAERLILKAADGQGQDLRADK
jgi:hypothetical protein